MFKVSYRWYINKEWGEQNEGIEFETEADARAEIAEAIKDLEFEQKVHWELLENDEYLDSGIKEAAPAIIIKELRNYVDLSQQEFSSLTYIPVNTLRNWEQGLSTPPKWALRLLEHYIKTMACNRTF